MTTPSNEYAEVGHVLAPPGTSPQAARELGRRLALRGALMLGVGSLVMFWVHGTSSAELWQVAIVPGLLLGLLRFLEGVAMWIFGAAWSRATRRQQFTFSAVVIAAVFVPILVVWLLQAGFK